MSEITPERRAYAEGWTAYLDGFDKNPYNWLLEPIKSSWWRRGYNDSKRQNGPNKGWFK